MAIFVLRSSGRNGCVKKKQEGKNFFFEAPFLTTQKNYYNPILDRGAVGQVGDVDDNANSRLTVLLCAK